MVKLSPKVQHNFDNITNNIIGSKVFIFDLETTGIFDKTNHYKYWDNSVFDPSRIIEIGYYYSDNFGLDIETNNTIHSYLRKPTDFDSIHPEAEKKHGISMDKLKADGFKFSSILNSGLLEMLCSADYIISHNTMFDYSILLNELHRFKLKNTIRKLQDIKAEKKLICTCRSSGFKSLESLYESIFDTKPEIAHRAGEDVKTLMEILLLTKLNTVYKTDLNQNSNQNSNQNQN